MTDGIPGVDDDARLYLKRLEDPYQAATKISRQPPATAEGAHARAEFDATLALIQLASAERTAEASLRTAEASLRTGRALTRATVVLAVATVVLAIATVVLVFVTAGLA